MHGTAMQQLRTHFTTFWRQYLAGALGVLALTGALLLPEVRGKIVRAFGGSDAPWQSAEPRVILSMSPSAAASVVPSSVETRLAVLEQQRATDVQGMQELVAAFDTAARELERANQQLQAQALEVNKTAAALQDSAAKREGPSGVSGKLNLNTATLDQLDALPGIGPSYAQRILDYRLENGPFKSVDELGEVPGIGDATLSKLRDLVTV